MTGAPLRTMLAAAVVVVAGATVVGGLFVMGSPTEARLLRLDERRVNDLQRISRAVDLHWTRDKELPGTLEEVPGLAGAGLGYHDPETGVPYEYRVIDPTTYELCAEFARETTGPPRPTDRFWSHPEGRQCFETEVEEVDRERRNSGSAR